MATNSKDVYPVTCRCLRPVGGVLVNAVCEFSTPPDVCEIGWADSSIRFRVGSSPLLTGLTVEELADCVEAVFRNGGEKHLGAVSQIEVVGIRPGSRVADHLLLSDNYLGGVVYGHDSECVVFACDLEAYRNPFLQAVRDVLQSPESGALQHAKQLYSGIGCQVFVDFASAVLDESAQQPMVRLGLVGQVSEKLGEQAVSEGGAAVKEKYEHQSAAMEYFLDQFNWHQSNFPSLGRVRLAAGVVAVLRTLRQRGLRPTVSDLDRTKTESVSSLPPPVTYYACRSDFYSQVCVHAAKALEVRAAASTSAAGNVGFLATALVYSSRAGSAELFKSIRTKLREVVQHAGAPADVIDLAKDAMRSLHDNSVDNCLEEARRTSLVKERELMLSRASELLRVAGEYLDTFIEGRVCRSQGKYFRLVNEPIWARGAYERSYEIESSVADDGWAAYSAHLVGECLCDEAEKLDSPTSDPERRTLLEQAAKWFGKAAEHRARTLVADPSMADSLAYSKRRQIEALARSRLVTSRATIPNSTKVT